MWLYWSARAHETLGNQELADARYTLAATDYLNSYYGRLAVKHLEHAPEGHVIVEPAETAAAGPAAPQDGADANPIAPLPPNARVVRALLGLELYDQAIDELHYAQ